MSQELGLTFVTSLLPSFQNYIHIHILIYDLFNYAASVCVHSNEAKIKLLLIPQMVLLGIVIWISS